GEKHAKLFPAELAADTGADLRPDYRTCNQQERENGVDGLRADGMEEGDVGGNENDLEERGADDHAGRHAEEVDHRRHHHEPAADAHDRGEDANHRADPERHQRADVKLGFAEPHLEGQAVDPVMLMQLLALRRTFARFQHRIDALDHHQDADGAEEKHVGERDHQIDLADGFQQGEDPGSDDRADDTANQQHEPHL